MRREVSRIEGFSDAVFGFALTLLVVSLEVPATYRDLAATLAGFLPFAVTFAVIVWIWYEHYLLFRKFGLEDGLTVFLNAVLLFLVLFFVYPLKFVFGNLIPAVTGLGGSGGFDGMTLDEARGLMAAYSGGFVAVFAVFVVLYAHAYRIRERLVLDRLTMFDARMGMRRHLLSVAIGCLSILLSFVTPDRWFWLAGTIYFVMGPVHGFFGARAGAARARLARADSEG